jgi:hypothetical protein
MILRIIIILLTNVSFLNAQSDIDRLIRSCEIIVNWLSFLKKDKTEFKTTANTKVIESVCVKNKLTDKIIFSLVGKDEDENSIKKELVIQKDGKECVFELPKGIYTYEIVLANK